MISKFPNPYKHIVAVVIFLIFTVLISWPTVLHINKQLYAQPGDAQATFWTFWWRDYASVNNLDKEKTNLINYPDGFNFSTGQKFTFYELAGARLTHMFGPVVAYDLIVLSCIWLAAITMYFLTYSVTGSFAGGIFSGLAYALSPYLIAHSLNHVGLITIFWLPLILLIILKTIRQPDTATTILGILAISVFVSDHFYYGIFLAMVLFVVGILATVAFGPKKTWGLLLILIPAVIVTFGLNFKVLTPLITKDRSSIVVTTSSRSVDELTTYSATPVGYFLPPQQSLFFGRYTAPKQSQKILDKGSNTAESTIYLGWTLLAVAIAGGVFLILKRKKLEKPVKIIGWLGIFCAGAGFYLSFAPTINVFGLTISQPGAWFWHAVPFLRVYSRFALLANFGLVLLAGIGIWQLNKYWRYTGLVALCLLLLEFLPTIPSSQLPATAETMPPVYKYLTENTTSPVLAEYPLLSSEDPTGYQYLRWQTIHQIPLIYGAPINSTADKTRKEMLSPGTTETVNLLIDRGVNYVIVHEALYGNSPQVKKYPSEYQEGKLPVIGDNRVRFVARFGTDALYRIDRTPPLPGL